MSSTEVARSDAASPQTREARGRKIGAGLRRFFAEPLNVLSAALTLGLILMALFAPLLAPYPFDMVAPDQQWEPPSLKHWMGTDEYGRDILSRVIYGARVSLAIGLAAVGFAMVTGVAIGAVAGYAGGLVDELIMRVVEVFMSIPGVVLALAIVGILGTSLPTIIVALSIYRVTQFARVTRGTVLSVKVQDYVSACHAIGMSNSRILFLHILPNCTGPIIVLATVLLGNVILTEATLSFLGMGIQPPMASWGVMIAAGNEYLMFAWWVSIFPGVFLLLTMLAFNLLGDGLRDFFDPRGRAAS